MTRRPPRSEYQRGQDPPPVLARSEDRTPLVRTAAPTLTAPQSKQHSVADLEAPPAQAHGTHDDLGHRLFHWLDPTSQDGIALTSKQSTSSYYLMVPAVGSYKRPSQHIASKPP